MQQPEYLLQIFPGDTDAVVLDAVDGPVILNTAYGAYRENFMSWAADAYVVKSADLTELKSTVRDILGEGQDAS